MWQNQNQQPAAAAVAPAAVAPAAAAPAVAAPPAARGPCPGCQKIMRKDNMARHIREACPGSEAGP